MAVYTSKPHQTLFKYTGRRRYSKLPTVQRSSPPRSGHKCGCRPGCVPRHQRAVMNLSERARGQSASGASAWLAGWHAGLCWLCFGRIGLGRLCLACWLACWVVLVVLRAHRPRAPLVGLLVGLLAGLVKSASLSVCRKLSGLPQHNQHSVSLPRAAPETDALLHHKQA